MKKLLIFIAVTTAVLFSYTICASAGEYEYIRVGLYYGSNATNSVTLSADTGISYGYFDGTSHCEAGTLQGTEFVISASSQSSVMINGVQQVNIEGSNLSVVPLEGNIGINGKKYRGSVIITNASETTLCVVNRLLLEEYLYGVIPSEMPSSWNIEALKAQAICARGFAISNFTKHLKYGFNVCATTNCQVYGGISAEKPSAIEAANATAGEVVTYDGKIIESLFYSSSGGHTANVENVWGSPYPYLCGVEDPYEPEDAPRHSWSATLTNEEISRILKDNDKDIGDLVSLTATNDETGRAYKLEAVGTEGTCTLVRQGTFSLFYSEGVLSQKYTLQPVVENSSSMYALGSKGKQKLKSKVALDGKGKKTSLDTGFVLLSSKGKHIGSDGKITGYTFNGGGWGHGVGMSQYGAQGMAEAGFKYDEILMHYYPGTKITNYYD